MSHCANFQFLGAMLLLVLSACNSGASDSSEHPSPPVGLYLASCEGDDGTISFQGAGVAVVKYGDCHEYRVDTWEYRIDDDIVMLAPQGGLDEPTLLVLFRIVAPDELERDGQRGFSVCAKCDTYVKE